MSVKSQTKLISDLANKVRKSDHSAYNRLFNLLWEQLFVFAQSIIMDENKAKDLVQEVWIDYWNRREKIEIKNIKSYLYQAVRYKIYNHFRDNNFNTVQLSIINEIYTNSIVEEQCDLAETLLIVNNSIKNLPLRCREIFTLSKLEGVPNIEIANRLGISKRTVENQLSIALKVVKEKIKSAYILVFILHFFL